MEYNISIHAGHGPYPGKSVGAMGILNESVEARKVVNELKKLIKCEDVTVNDPLLGSNQILRELVNRMNSQFRIINLSIHLNASTNLQANGCECWVYGESEVANKLANDIRDSICATLGVNKRENRKSKTLYVLKNTNNPTIIIECCFVTSMKDAKVWDAKKCAQAIHLALYKNIDNIDAARDKRDEDENDTITSSGEVIYNDTYKVQVGAFGSYINAQKLANQLKQAGFECFIKKE